MSGEDRKPGSSKSSAARICPAAASATQTARPFASIVFSPDGSGTIWTEEFQFGGPYQRGMATMSLIDPNTMLAVWYTRDKAGSVHRFGQAITVRKKQ
jgi:hypothetical protein